jgi:hypothetical protein
MKYFQLIFLVFCVSMGAHNGGAVLDPYEPLRWTYAAVVERSKKLTYEDFDKKVAGDLQRFVMEISDSLQLLDPEKSVRQRLEATRAQWKALQTVCPDERRQRLILATAMEFLDQPEFQKGYFSGGEVFWTLRDYLQEPNVPNVFWDMAGKSIIALYYLMKRHPSVERCSIYRDDLPQVAEDVRLETPRMQTFRAPSAAFERQFSQARIADLAQAVRTLQTSHASFVEQFVEEGQGSLYHVTEKLAHPAPLLNSTLQEPRRAPIFTQDKLSPRAYLGDEGATA